jgi:hypothetical protein
VTLGERDAFRARLDAAENLDQVNALLDELHEIAKHDADAYYVIGHANAILQLDYGILNPLGVRPD